MASIRQKPSGKWEARYRDARGRTHARSFGGKMAARRWAAEMESDLRRGEWIDPKLARITFGAWAEEYLTTIVHLRNVTRGDYERALRTHILPHSLSGRSPRSSRWRSGGSWPTSRRRVSPRRACRRSGWCFARCSRWLEAQGLSR
jgi:hypothetical protein